MASYGNFKSKIVVDKDPLVKDAKTVKVTILPISTSADPNKPANLKVYTDEEKISVKY